jgi:hypothetical protein
MKAKVLAAALTVVVSGSVYARGGDDNSLRNIGSNVSSVTQVGVVNFNIGAQSLGRFDVRLDDDVRIDDDINFEVSARVDAPSRDPYLDLGDLKKIEMVASSIFGNVSISDAITALEIDAPVLVNSLNSTNKVDVDSRIEVSVRAEDDSRVEFDDDLFDSTVIDVNIGGSFPI